MPAGAAIQGPMSADRHPHLPELIGWITPWRNALAMSLAAMVVLPCLAIQAHAQALEPGQMSMTALKSQTEFLVVAGKYEEALPLLKEFISRVGEIQSAQAEEELERSLFTYGFSLMITDKTSESIDVLKEYLDKFKGKNNNRTTRAREMLADAYFTAGEYALAAPLYIEHAASTYTPDDRKRYARMALVDSYAIPRNWAEGRPVLEELLKIRGDPDLRSRAAAALCRAYVEINEPEKVFDLISVLGEGSGGGRYDLEFNLAMIAAGDRLLAAGKQDMALPVFQVAAPKRLIGEWLADQRDYFERMRASLRDTRGIDAQTLISINHTLKRLAAQQQQLEETENYDEELRLRLATGFLALKRKWEGYWVYESFMEDFEESAFRPQAAYATFALAGELGMRDRAKSAGERYLEEFPEGEDANDLRLQLAQIYLADRDFGPAVELAKAALDKGGDGIFADRLAFLAGYGLFQDERFEEAAEMFDNVVKNFPDSEQVEPARYWRAMTFLYRNEFETAGGLFDAFVKDFRDTSLGEDADFRQGVCLYAMEKFEEAKEHLEGFIARHRSAPQVGEAKLLLGDIAGSFGKLQEALDHYMAVDTTTASQATIDYATAQIGKILEVRQAWEQMRDHYSEYLTKYGTSGLYAEAVYRKGFAMHNLGDTQGAADMYLKAIRDYGNDPQAIGIDMVLQSWAETYEELHGSPVDEIRKELEKARSDGKQPLALRWQRLLDEQQVKGNITPRISDGLEPTEDVLAISGPAGLLWLGGLASERGDHELAAQIYSRLLTTFPETEWCEQAYMRMATDAERRGDASEAVLYYTQIRELFPMSESAPVAYEKEAILLASLGRYEESNALLSQILEMKEWRGENWARALYLLGMNHLAMKKVEEAFAYFQRVYVLYAHYKEWAGISYLKSAECLAALGKSAESIRTLQEFTADTTFEGLDSYREAKKRLAEQTPGGDNPQG